ncbi:MAG: hypothetical protein E5V64_06410 [Mesorhizobium sp.]|uniref:hypothetical protein n=1 Tax=Mesorhizobium sp. TaxID=1871066 RepID=UPI00122AF410|nr:hypothetical protein [Mesorhizobium sp.]TIV83794.1 MAG: hypothetical protein E5V64_06410 [Mesorhizobium sp.]
MLSLLERKQFAQEAWAGDTRALNKLWLDATEDRLIPAGSTLQLVESLHEGKTILLDTLAGSTVTLPASTGKGAKYRFCISTVPTSNSHIVKVQNSTDVMSGVIVAKADDAASTLIGWSTAASSDTVTLNRTTSGGTIKGEWIEVEDIAAGFWAIRGVIAATGTEVTPFSATV